MTANLRLVPPSQRPHPFEIEVFAFARIGDDIFICSKGEWELARSCPDSAKALLRWTTAISAEAGRAGNTVPATISDSLAALRSGDGATGRTPPKPPNPAGGEISAVEFWPERGDA